MLGRLRRLMDPERVCQRPLWQRVLYPILGLAAAAFGLFALVMPVVPGAFLIPIGIVMLMCFDERCEAWSKRAVTRAMDRMSGWWSGFMRRIRRSPRD